MSTCWMCTVWVVNVNTVNSVNNELITYMKELESTETPPPPGCFQHTGYWQNRIYKFHRFICYILKGWATSSCAIGALAPKGVSKEVIKRSVTFPIMKTPPWASSHSHGECCLRKTRWVVCSWVHALVSLQTSKIYIFLLSVSTGWLKLTERFNLWEPAGVSTEGKVLRPRREEVDTWKEHISDS